MSLQYTLEGRIGKDKNWTKFGDWSVRHVAVFSANLCGVRYRLRDNETGKIVWRG